MKRIWVVAAIAAAGCGAKHTAAWETKTAADVKQGEATSWEAAKKEGDDQWAKRDDKAALAAAIAAWDKAVAARPDDWETYGKLARAAYLLADGHLSFEGEGMKQQYLEMHERGMGYGERALVARNPKLKEKLQSGAKLEDSLDLIDKDDVPGIYWYTSNLGKWANAQGFTTVLKYKSKIKAQIERCATLDEHYFYSAPYRYLGVIYAKAPAIAGGDMKKAKEYFDKSIQNQPNYLATRVLWAEFYAVKAEDKDGFKRELEWVLKQPDDVIPEIVAESKVEKKKAQRLLSQIDEKF